MVEEVTTGGVMRFQYEKGQGVGKLDAERKALLEQGYREAEERKRRERRNRRILWLIILLVLIAVTGYFVLQHQG